MGLMDRLREMFGGSKTETPKVDKVEKIDQELAVERVQHDVERERLADLERTIEPPSSFDDRP